MIREREIWEGSGIRQLLTKRLSSHFLIETKPTGLFIVCFCILPLMNQKYSKEEIIELGAELMRQNGYHATGINDILREAGIPKGSFYNFFPTKEAFAGEAMRWYGARMQRAMAGIFSNPALSPLARLKKFYGLVIAGNAEEDYQHGCLVNNFNNEVAGNNAYLAEEANRQFNLWLDELEACVAEAQATGELTDEFPPRELAEFIHTSFFGALSRMKSSRNGAALTLVYNLVFASIEA